MDLKIKESGPFVRRSLEVLPAGVIYEQKDFEGSLERSFQFREIECILLAANDELSLQVKGKVYAIQIRPQDKQHRQAIKNLLKGVGLLAMPNSPAEPDGNVLSDEIYCPDCGAELKLTAQERAEKKFACHACKETFVVKDEEAGPAPASHDLNSISKDDSEASKSGSAPFLRKYGLLILFGIMVSMLLIRALNSDEYGFKKSEIQNDPSEFIGSTQPEEYAPFFDSTSPSGLLALQLQDTTTGFSIQTQILADRIQDLSAKKKLAGVDWKFAILYCEAREGEAIHLRMIVVKTYSDAQKIISRLKTGDSFNTLAAENSIHPSSTRGGDIGKFSRSDLSEEFQTALKGIPAGGYTNVVQLKVNDQATRKI